MQKVYAATVGKCHIVSLNTAIGAPLNGFAAFAMIEIHRKILARVAIQTAVAAFASVDKKVVWIHSNRRIDKG